MTTIAEDSLSELITADVGLKSIEPHIYSVFSNSEVTNSYDSSFGNIYDRVACSALYNRLIWGYSVTKFACLTRAALTSSKKGNVLDLGCGSLAFTARAYTQYPDRPIILMDQSLKMLKIAKARLIRLNGNVPNNIVFLHADALQIPFQQNSFNAIISLNLLHCIDDTKKVLMGLKSILSEGGKMYFTTLVKGNRLADRYLKVLSSSGKLVSRGIEEHQTAFNQLGISVEYAINGNMAFICCG